VWSNVLIGTGSHPDGVVRVLDPQALYRQTLTQLQGEWNDHEALQSELAMSTASSLLVSQSSEDS